MSVKQTLPPHHPVSHVSNGQYQNGENTNQNQIKNSCLFFMSFQVLKVRLIKICKAEQSDLLFLVVFISLYFSRYHFSQIFRTSFSIIGRKDFCHKFSFLTDSVKHSHLLNGQNLLTMRKVFWRCSLTPSRKALFFKIKYHQFLNC